MSLLEDAAVPLLHGRLQDLERRRELVRLDQARGVIDSCQAMRSAIGRISGRERHPPSAARSRRDDRPRDRDLQAHAT